MICAEPRDVLALSSLQTRSYGLKVPEAFQGETPVSSFTECLLGLGNIAKPPFNLNSWLLLRLLTKCAEIRNEKAEALCNFLSLSSPFCQMDVILSVTQPPNLGAFNGEETGKQSAKSNTV